MCMKKKPFNCLIRILSCACLRFGTFSDLHCFVIGKGDFGSLQNKLRFGLGRSKDSNLQTWVYKCLCVRVCGGGGGLMA